jgi:hypothetical protein
MLTEMVAYVQSPLSVRGLMFRKEFGAYVCNYTMFILECTQCISLRSDCNDICSLPLVQNTEILI